MEPPAVHEHGREHGPVLRYGVHEADQAGSELQAAARLGGLQDLAGDQTKIADGPRERTGSTRTLNKNEGKDVGEDDCDGDDGGLFGGVLVLVGEHGI